MSGDFVGGDGDDNGGGFDGAGVDAALIQSRSKTSS